MQEELVKELYITRMNTKVSVYKNGDYIILKKYGTDDVLSVLYDLRKSKFDGLDIRGNCCVIELLGGRYMYSVIDEGEVFVVTDNFVAHSKEEDYDIDRANTTINDIPSLKKIILDNPEYTFCFGGKLDKNGEYRLVVLYTIDRSGRVNEPNDVCEIPNNFRLMPYEDSHTGEGFVMGPHMKYLYGLELIKNCIRENGIYTMFKWVGEDPKNRKMIVSTLFDDEFYSSSIRSLNLINEVIYNHEFIEEVMDVRESYRKRLDDIVKADIAIRKIYRSIKPDNVIDYEVNEVYKKYNMGYMMGRRYTDINFTTAILIEGIKSGDIDL